MSYLCYLYVFAYSGVQHILCCVFVLFLFVLCTVPYVISFSGLSILYCPFGIFYRLFKLSTFLFILSNITEKQTSHHKAWNFKFVRQINRMTTQHT
jgi:hypothetical protein